MVWQDLLFDRWIDEKALVRALATVFHTGAGSILIVDEIKPALDVSRIEILGERTRRRGDFPLRLSVYLRDVGPTERVDSFDATVRVVRELPVLCRSRQICRAAGGRRLPDLPIEAVSGAPHRPRYPSFRR